MMIIGNNHDRHQIELMKKNLLFFCKKSIGLYELTSNLYGLYRSIKYSDKSWKEKFFNQLLNLESVNASFRENDYSEFTKDREHIVTKSVEEMVKLVDYALDSYLKIYNSSISRTAEIGDEKWLICPDCLDAWESTSKDAMVICPFCNSLFHNPRYNRLI
jgi:hypothetical protein